MTGAVLQLKCRGTQDKYLTGQPQFSFFHQIYKRSTNFAISNETVHFNEHINFGKTISCYLPKRGDMLSKMYFQITLPALTATSGTYAGYTNSIGHAIIKNISFEIGGNLVDKKYGLYMELLNELTVNQTDNSNALIGKYLTTEAVESNATSEQTYYVPLPFWFTESLGSSLPLIALRGHRIRIIIELNDFNNLIVYDGTTPPTTESVSSAQLNVDFIYLDDSERNKMKNRDHTFLINQLQYQTEIIPNGLTNYQSYLDFNHPTRELMFVLIDTNSILNNDLFNFSVYGSSPVAPLLSSARLLIDGKERMECKDEKYLRLVQSNQYHRYTTSKHIYLLPFSHQPESFQPSGSLNFSSIDSAVLDLNLQNGNPDMYLHVFAINYNFYIIRKGMGTLLFST